MSPPVQVIAAPPTPPCPPLPAGDPLEPDEHAHPSHSEATTTVPSKASPQVPNGMSFMTCAFCNRETFYAPRDVGGFSTAGRSDERVDGDRARIEMSRERRPRQPSVLSRSWRGHC